MIFRDLPYTLLNIDLKVRVLSFQTCFMVTDKKILEVYHHDLKHNAKMEERKLISHINESAWYIYKILV